MDVSEGAAYTMVSRMKDRVESAIGAYLMVKAVDRDCDALHEIVAEAHPAAVTPKLARRVNRHVQSCDACNEEHKKLVAPSNIITLINSFPEYWKPFLAGTWYKRVGDPMVEGDLVDMQQRSPLNYVDQIEAPLLVVHGANDPRVKQDESDRIVAARRGK